MINPHTKYEIFMFTRYEDMEGNATCRNWGRLEWLGVTQGHRQHRHPIERTWLSIRLYRNYRLCVYLLQFSSYK